ncbi:hypothetical protein BKA57DRAFT_452535 [Linnemannia elongata]|nr:hypothetical protein BKA57DRAFT_452535 [Linnemannia elongata]
MHFKALLVLCGLLSIAAANPTRTKNACCSSDSGSINACITIVGDNCPTNYPTFFNCDADQVIGLVQVACNSINV